MAFKYKLVEKLREPGNPTAGKNWRGAPSSATSLSGKAMTRAATKNTTMAPIELEAALDLLADFIPEQLLQGHTVTIPGLGYFRLTFKSKGADTVEGFVPQARAGRHRVRGRRRAEGWHQLCHTHGLPAGHQSRRQRYDDTARRRQRTGQRGRGQLRINLRPSL